VLASCAPEEGVCDAVAGTYQPLYMQMAGNCGPLNGARVPLDGGEGGVKTHQEMQFDKMVTTMVVHKGCTLRVTQEVSLNGVLESRMNGEEIAVHNSNELSGQVTFTRFTNGVPQTELCAGLYTATFQRPNSIFE
jgi:hypothetical protein